MDTGYHRDNLRDSLIEQGRKLLIIDGYENFSLRKLAKQLDVSHTAPYRHFKSREDLLLAIVTLDGERFNRALVEGVAGVTDPAERLYRLGEAYVLFFLDNPETLVLYTVLPRLIAEQGERLMALIYPEQCSADGPGDYGNDEGLSLLEGAAGPFAARHPGLTGREVILGYWAKVHGLASLLVSQKGFIPEKEIKESIARIIRSPF